MRLRRQLRRCPVGPARTARTRRCRSARQRCSDAQRVVVDKGGSLPSGASRDTRGRCLARCIPRRYEHSPPALRPRRSSELVWGAAWTRPCSDGRRHSGHSRCDPIGAGSDLRLRADRQCGSELPPDPWGVPRRAAGVRHAPRSRTGCALRRGFAGAGWPPGAAPVEPDRSFVKAGSVSPCWCRRCPAVPVVLVRRRADSKAGCRPS